MDVLALALEAGRAVRHDAPTLSRPDGAAEVALMSEERARVSWITRRCHGVEEGPHVLPDVQNLHSLHSAV